MSDQPVVKICGTCRKPLPPENFYQLKSRPGHLSSRCKACAKETAMAWQAAHPERVKASGDRYRESHPRQKKIRNKLAPGEAGRAYYERNKEEVKLKAKLSKAKMKLELPERFRALTAISNNRTRAKRKGLRSDFVIEDWDQLICVFDGKCAWCGGVPRFLDLDHILPISAGGEDVAGNIVPICRPCNAQKGHMPPEQFARVMGVDLDELRMRAHVRRG